MQAFVLVASRASIVHDVRSNTEACSVRHQFSRGNISARRVLRSKGAARTSAAVSTPSSAPSPAPIPASNGASPAAAARPPQQPVVDYLERVLVSKVYAVVAETSLQHAPLLSARTDNKILLKREDTTVVNSFKVRGAFNMMANADPALLTNGVVAASAGNHAQGVALSAQVLGVPATIVMPQVTPRIKVDAVKRRGAKAVLHGDTFDQAKAKALELAEQESRLFVPPFDHPDVIAGQGTVGLELIRQCPHMDVVFVPVGGGGLIAGIATIIKRLRPRTRIVGVEPRDADALYRSLAADKRVRLDSVGTFADGVAVIEVGEETFRLCRELVDEVILVNTDEICAAIKDIFEETRSILEPAGALSVAGAKAYVTREGIIGKTLVTILSGANMNFDRLRHVSERAEIGEGREAIFAVTIPEKPGAFRELISSLGTEVNISEFNYRYAGTGCAHVFLGASLSRRKEAISILTGLESKGYQVLDMTDNELAKLHIRHLVGGNPPAGCAESVYRFEFPERPGALRRFLFDLPKGWNITMFHYRNHGTDVGRVLVGLDTSENALVNMDEFLSRVGYKAIREDDNLAYKFFLGGVC